MRWWRCCHSASRWIKGVTATQWRQRKQAVLRDGRANGGNLPAAALLYREILRLLHLDALQMSRTVTTPQAGGRRCQR